MTQQKRGIRPIRDTFIIVVCVAVLTSWLPVSVATVICFIVMGLVLFAWAKEKADGFKTNHPSS